MGRWAGERVCRWVGGVSGCLSDNGSCCRGNGRDCCHVDGSEPGERAQLQGKHACSNTSARNCSRNRQYALLKIAPAPADSGVHTATVTTATVTNHIRCFSSTLTACKEITCDITIESTPRDIGEFTGVISQRAACDVTRGRL